MGNGATNEVMDDDWSCKYACFVQSQNIGNWNTTEKESNWDQATTNAPLRQLNATSRPHKSTKTPLVPNMKTNSQNKRYKGMTRIRCAVFLAVFLCNGICALQLSMVASRAPFQQSYEGSSSRNLNSLKRSISPPAPKDGVTSSLVSNLAIVALKMRLKGQTHVGCDVTASSSDVLLKGEVGPVTVRGRGWQSNLGLTCRAIEATVDKCCLDMGRMLTNQKLVLTTPGESVLCF